MALSFLGIALLLIPFLLIFCFKNKTTGFFYISGLVIITNLLIALITQFFHVFYYPVIITIHSLLALIVFFIIFRKCSKDSFKVKINWLVIIGFLIIFFELWSVHFFYTGAVKTIYDEQRFSRSSYAYPSFSDEWVGVAFSNYSIKHNALPTENPLSTDRRNNNFPNIFVPFFSLISEIFLAVNIAPIFAYVYLSIASGLIICLLVFLLLKVNGVSSNVSLITTLFIPLVVNGSNLPGLWYLIPFTYGLIIFLLSLIGFSLNKHLFSILLAVLSCLLYPPLFVFVIPTIIAYLITEKNLKKIVRLELLLFSFFTLLLFVVLIIVSQMSSANYLIDLFINGAWRLNLDGGIPTFYVWLVVPVIVLPFSILGLFSIFNKKKFFIVVPTLLSLMLWGFYSFSQFYFFIDYARVVIFSSFLIVTLSGFGLSCAINKGQKFFTDSRILIGTIFIVFVFFILSFFYTDQFRWQNLKLKVFRGGIDNFITPTAPINHYLIEDDLRLFSEISKKRFLAPPWKGLVLGAATDNYPLESKGSIVTNTFLNYDKFISSPCDIKKEVAKKSKLSYVYAPQFNCHNFSEIGKSQEGLYLYKFIK